jgi:hypothetical protein
MADITTYNSYDPLGGYSINPTPQQGSGAYGAVPGAITVPPNTFQQLQTAYPNFASETGAVSANIGNELAGQLSPETIAALQSHAATFGVQNGMPESNFAGNYGLESLGQSVETMQRQGIQDYASLSGLLGNEQTPQSTALGVASNNATMAAAPNPQEAAAQQLANWQAGTQAGSAAGGGGVSGGGVGGLALARNPATGAVTNTSGGINPVTGQPATTSSTNPYAAWQAAYGTPSAANPYTTSDYTGAGTTGTVSQGISGGTYTDPNSGITWSQDPTTGTWSNAANSDEINSPSDLQYVPAGATQQPTSSGLMYFGSNNSNSDTIGYQPTSSGSMYFGSNNSAYDTGGYYDNSNASLDAWANQFGDY